jgi:hypothetical protein
MCKLKINKEENVKFVELNIYQNHDNFMIFSNLDFLCCE